MEYLLFSALLFALSFISGMLGLGVAFISTPVLGLFGFDLKLVIMPWSLLLNSITAISGAVAFAARKWWTGAPLFPAGDHHSGCAAWFGSCARPDKRVWWFVGVLLWPTAWLLPQTG
jgi:uncharacterized membrane protein YfcA